MERLIILQAGRNGGGGGLGALGAWDSLPATDIQQGPSEPHPLLPLWGPAGVV